MLKPRLYSSFLLWLLSELFETSARGRRPGQAQAGVLLRRGTPAVRRCPPALRQRVEQVVRIIRSKGVGVYFCSQFPDDIPDEILGQLGNRVQHALRAYTPRDQKAVRTAAETFVRIRSSTSPRRSASWASARRWCPRCRTKASRCRSSGP
jgi:uncharacterized protein